MLVFFVASNSRTHNILIDSLWNDHFGLFLLLDGGHLGFSHVHNFKINPNNRCLTPKINKKQVSHEILGQPNQKLAVYNGLHLVAEAFFYFGGINLTFSHLYDKYYYYDLNKTISNLNSLKKEFHWETNAWNKWIIAFHRDRLWPFWIVSCGKFRPPSQKRGGSLFSYKYLKLPKTIYYAIDQISTIHL